MSSVPKKPFDALSSRMRLLALEASGRANEAAAGSFRRELAGFKHALGQSLDGFRYSAIGVCGVFGTEKCQSVAAILAQSIVQEEHLTTTVARVTRQDVFDAHRRAPDSGEWQQTLRPSQLNFWPAGKPDPSVRYSVDSLELLQWLRVNSEFSLVTFDALGDVINRVAMAKRLDGLVIVNSGRQLDLELMSAAASILKSKGVRMLGQVRNTVDPEVHNESATGVLR